MKQPKLTDLSKSVSETRAIRSRGQMDRSVKITINIDADTITELKSISEETGVPYQRLLNKLLRESLKGIGDTPSRLDRLEKELKRLKSKVAA